MTLWLLMIILCSATAVVISVPLIRRYDDKNNVAQEIAIYQDQLKEVERDQATGTIDAPEAQAARAEIQRRLAAVPKDLKTTEPLSYGWKSLALALTSGIVILGSVNLYGLLGAPDMPSVSSEQQTTAGGPAQVKSMVDKLKARLQTNPQDAEGWRTLGWAQFNTQNYAESAEAYAKALAIDPTNTNYKSAYVESLVQSSDGIVTPKAQTLIAEVLAKDPKDYRVRFYDALAREQSGDKNGALDRWISLLADSPSDAGWLDDVKKRIINLGKYTGRDVSAVTNLPKVPQQNSQSSDDQMAMIQTMVAKLASRLKENPNDPEGWIGLIKSYQVLNDPVSAKDALAQATAAFAKDPANKDKIIAAAKELGVQ